MQLWAKSDLGDESVSRRRIEDNDFGTEGDVHAVEA